MAHKKIGRNDQCWCGSGKKYKHCHLNREKEQTLPYKAIASQMAGRNKLEICLHPNANPNSCDEIISAHTLQRSRVLKSIINKSNKVGTFYPPECDEYGSFIIHEIGWKKASVFPGFCKKHDESTFAELEKSDFTGSKKEIFLISYRAICWELYQKLMGLKFISVESDLIDRGQSQDIQELLQYNLTIQNAGLRAGIDLLRSYKYKMDQSLLNDDVSNYSAYEIRLSGQVSVVATGGINPNYLLDGTKIQSLNKLSSKLQYLTFGIDIISNGLSIVFMWSNNDTAVKAYIDDINSLSDSELSEFLIQFFFIYCENTYFSTDWWHSLSNSKKILLHSLANIDNPYAKYYEYSYSLNISPWTVISRKFL